jgi:hypothetical protein
MSFQAFKINPWFTQRRFGLMSIVAPVIAGLPWIVMIQGVAPGLMNAANGYAGMLIYIFLLLWTVLVCGAGFVFGVMSLMRREPNRLLAIAGMIISAYVILRLKH